MKAEDVVKKENLWIEDGFDGTIIASFTKIGENQYCSLICTIDYEVEKEQWFYHFVENDYFEKEGFENAKEKMIELLKEEVKERQTDRELLLKRLMTELSFSNVYELKIGSQSLHRKHKLIFKEAKIGKEEIHMILYFNKKNQRSTLMIHTEKETGIKFQWAFAKTYFKDMKEFEDFLLKKSKDRLRLLF